MADFHTVLKRAVSALPDKSGPNRRAVYDKARKALLKQLQSLDPPLPAQEVTQQRLALEDAIRKLEAEIARAGRSTPSAASPTAPAAARPSAPPRPAPPRPAPPLAQPDADDDEQPTPAPRAAAPRAPVAAPRANAPTVTPRAPTAAPPRPAAPAVDAADEDASAEIPVADVPQRRREPTLGRPAAPSSEPEAEELGTEAADDASDTTSGRRGAFRRPFGRGDAGRGAPAVPPEAGPQDDLSDEEIEEAAAEAEEPAIAPTADRRGWLRRRKGTPEPTVTLAAADPDPQADESYADDGQDGLREDDGYEDEAYEDEAYDDGYDDGGYDEPYYAEEEQGRRRSFRWLVAPIIIIVILGAGALALYTQRDTIMAMVTSPSGETSEPASSSETTASGETAADADSNKISDRIGAPSENEAAPVVAPDARTVKTTRVVTPRNGNGEPAASNQALPGTAPAQSPAATGTSQTATAPAEDVRDSTPAPADGTFEAVLYEEGASAAQGGNALRGTLDWQYTEESIGGQPPEPVVKATLRVPDRDMTVDLLFRKNSDSALPASHLIEAQFNLSDDFPGGGIANVPGLIMKQTEAAQGNALLGASAKVSDNLFWIALSASDADQQKNLQLLKDRSWIDIPLLYTNGGRAILTLDKGPDGAEAIDQALAAWGEG
ncbi:hypothetical protein [Amorphus coralli]|uniref:hypothetical protein n=1 Tax=Amorphus coralli TaxID=340680 RepID=UPI0004281BEA|nr:hypothetical protein [Amorphus coralli]